MPSEKLQLAYHSYYIKDRVEVYIVPFLLDKKTKPLAGARAAGDLQQVVVSGQPMEHFIDVYSGEDLYPEGLWSALSSHLEMLHREGKPLPGGRYSCAQALLDCQLPLLTGRSLGEVCHKNAEGSG